MLTQEKLKELLHYNPETGIFTWKVRTTRRNHVGDAAGTINKNGYLVIGIGGRHYFAHRLAWLYEYGCFPDYGLDHRDRTRHHNWINNLREASNQCNIRNCGNFKHNTSGVKGVSFCKRNNKWRAYIKVNKKPKNLGYYFDFDDAACARLAGEQACKWANCDSNSPAYQYVKENIQP